MGVSTSTGQFSRKLNRYATKLELNDRDAMREAGDRTVKLLNVQARMATGGDQLLSGYRAGGKAKPAPLKAVSRVEKRKWGYQAYVRARGPWQLVENDVKRHMVTSKRTVAPAAFRGRDKRGRQRRNSKASRERAVLGGATLLGPGKLKWQEGGKDRFAQFTIAESKGRQPWQKGVAAAKPITTRMFVQRQRRTIRESFK